MKFDNLKIQVFYWNKPIKWKANFTEITSFQKNLPRKHFRFHREIPFLKRKENSNIDTKELLTRKIDDNRNDHWK